MSGGLVNLSGVEVRRRGRLILSVERLEIGSGAFVGVLGTNGAGKTTLLKVCCGLIGPGRGEVRFDGVDLGSLGGWGKSGLRRRIGYVPQSAEYNAELPFTLREVVAMGRASVRGLLGRLERGDYEVVDEWIERLGLAGRGKQTFRSLSGGEQQKGLIARAMVQEPEILMLDEPCSNLDFKWKYEITEIIDELYREAGITIVMVSHETSLLPAGCGRLVLLDEGRVVADGGVEEILGSAAFERAYGCRVEILHIGGRRYTVNTGRR
jgi:iron complex transport system ATP-binding protein